MEKKDIRSLPYVELEKEMLQLTGQKFHVKQIYNWLHKQLVSSYDEMTNLKKELRGQLADVYPLCLVTMIDQRVSKKDGTKKFLFRFDDGKVIESVFMKYKHGNSVCISSQAGCRMGCRFCASTIGGLERNLTPFEMLAQIYEIQKSTNERVSNVVVMGTGEPLDNLENLLDFLTILTDENGLNISQRNVTISTCGLIPEIYKLAEKRLQITLAISLHAPNDAVRKQLMPVANVYSIKEILKAVRYYFDQTGRRITFEYSLCKGVNDGMDHARELSSLLKNCPAHINLIPVNPIKERDFQHTNMQNIQKFKLILEKNRINVTIRREMGSDIDAACGQLRKSYMDNIS